MSDGVERFETSLGEIVWDHGFTTPETAEHMYDVMDLQRACQLYLWSLSIVGQAQWRSAYRENFAEFRENSFVLAQSYEGRLGVLTVNQSSEYFFGWTNVQHQAAILEIPAGVVVGLVTDMWQRGLTDLGWFGPNTGTGGTYVISGPETPRDAIPDIKGATVLTSETNNIWLLVRFLDFEGQPPVKEMQNGVRFYFAGDEPSQHVIPAGDTPSQNYQPRGIRYWELLHEIIQEEPVEDRDRFFMYWLMTLGIERGQPFAPDDRQRRILEEGALVGETMAKTMVYSERLHGVLRHDGWRLIIGGELPDAFEHTQRMRDYDLFDPRARFTYEACTSSPRMANPAPGKGQAYAGVFADSNGDRLFGEHSYVMRVPADPPAELFWSMVIYDADTRTLIYTDQRKATIGSRATPDMIVNDDGSVNIFVGPEPPAGWEENWIKSIPGRGWFPYIRLYAPAPAWFDDSYSLPQVERVDFATVEPPPASPGRGSDLASRDEPHI